MKMVRILSLSIAGLFVMTSVGFADSTSSDPGNDAMQVDPDGVPLNLQNQPHQLSQDEIDVLQKEQQRAQQNKNWLVRGYEHQLQSRAGANQNLNENLFYQLSSNKALAKLAGVPALDEDDDQDGQSASKMGISPAASRSAALRPDSATGDKNNNTGILSQLVRPLNSSAAKGPTSFASSLPFAMPSPLAGNFLPAQLQVATAKAPDEQTIDSTDLSMPGMVASKSTLADPTDSTLDVLPGETIEHARDHQDDSNSLLELSLPMNADQLHKTQAAALSPQGPTNLKATTATAKTTPPVNVNAKPIEDHEAPMPVNQTPPINPVRAPIANPFDILNR